MFGRTRKKILRAVNAALELTGAGGLEELVKSATSVADSRNKKALEKLEKSKLKIEKALEEYSKALSQLEATRDEIVRVAEWEILQAESDIHSLSKVLKDINFLNP